MVAILKHVGTTEWDRERLNMSVNTPARCSEDGLGMLSGPAVLQGLTCLNILLKSAMEKERGEHSHGALTRTAGKAGKEGI